MEIYAVADIYLLEVIVNRHYSKIKTNKKSNMNNFVNRNFFL